MRTSRVLSACRPSCVDTSLAPTIRSWIAQCASATVSALSLLRRAPTSAGSVPTRASTTTAGSLTSAPAVAQASATPTTTTAWDCATPTARMTTSTTCSASNTKNKNTKRKRKLFFLAHIHTPPHCRNLYGLRSLSSREAYLGQMLCG